MISVRWKIAIICILTILAYSPSLLGWYQSDDMTHLNRFIHLDFSEMLSRVWSGHTYENIDRDQHYRPITNVVLWFLFNLKSVPLARMLILLIHLLNGFLFYRIVSRERTFANLSLWGMAIFLLLPAASHAVLWMSALGDLLCVAFALAMILQLQDYFVHNSKKPLILAVLFFVASFLSKEMSFSIPFILFLYMFSTGKKGKFTVPLLFLAVLAGAFLVRNRIIGTLVMGSSYNDSLLGFGPRTVIGAGKYILNFLIPAHAGPVTTHPFLAVTALPTVVIIALFFRRVSKGNVATALLLAGAIALSIGPVVNLCNPWYLYYPSIIVTILMLHFTRDLPANIRTGLLALIVVVNVVCLTNLSVETFRVGRFTRELTRLVEELPEESVRILNVPVMVRGGAIAVHSGGLVGVAIKAVHPEQSKNVTFAGRKIVCAIPGRVALTKVTGQRINLSTSESGFREYFLLHEEEDDIPVRYRATSFDRVKKATGVEISWDDTVATYVASFQ